MIHISFFATTIIRTAYGFENNEPLIHLAETLVQELAEAAVPGRFLVNHFPLLRYVPSWFPGAGFQKHFKQVAQMNYDVLFPPFEEAKRDVVSTRLLFILFRFGSLINVMPGKWKEKQSSMHSS